MINHEHQANATQAESVLKFIGLIIISILLFCSCSIFKHKNKNQVKSEVHHYHDSTYYHEKETIREVKVAGDTTNATFNLEELLKNGYGKSTDRHFTTEIRYVDGNLNVTTTMDSLIQRISELEKSFSKVNSNDATIIDSKTKDKVVEVKNYWPIIITLLAIIILLIAGFIIYQYFKGLKPRIL